MISIPPPPVKLPRPPARRSRLALWLLVGLGAALALALYADTLALPFFEDDPVHIRWLSWHPGLLDPWRSAEMLPDYRPLGRFIMQMWARLLGWHDPVILRAHNLLLHALNAALTAALTLRLHRGRGRDVAAGLAALLFAAFPFAYQAVPWINVLFYPLVTFLLLAMALAYIEGRARGRGRLILLALGLAFLAPFEIEHAVMAFTLLAALEGLWWLWKWQARVWAVGPAAAMVGNVIFVFIWAAQPRFEYSFGFPTPERIAKIAVYFLQGLSFPAAPLARLPYDRGLTDNLLPVVLVGLPALLTLAWLLWRRGRGFLLLMALAWFGLLSVPSLLYLEFDYVHDSPRLLYPVAPAAAMLWGTLAAQAKKRSLETVLAAALLMGGVGIGSVFVREQVWFYKLGAAPIAEADAIAARVPDDAMMLLVNMPSWVSTDPTAYVLGNFGAQVFPFWLDAGDMIFAQRGEEQAAREVAFPNVNQPTRYYHGLAGDVVDWETLRNLMREARGGVYLARYAPDAIHLEAAGRIHPGPLSAPTATFGDSIVLETDTINVEVSPYPHVRVVLRWRIDAKRAANETVFLHLTAPSGEVVAQADGYPLLGLAPFWLWEPGDILEEIRRVPYTPDSSYQLWLGVYNADTGDRLPGIDASGAPLEDDRLLLWAQTSH